MTFKDEVKKVYYDYFDDTLANISDTATKIIDQLIKMFDLQLISYPDYYNTIHFQNQNSNLIENRYVIILRIEAKTASRPNMYYTFSIADRSFSPSGKPSTKEIFFTRATSFDNFYAKLSNFLEE